MREVYTEEHQIEYLRQGVRDLKKAMMKLDECIGDCDQQTANAVSDVWDEIEYLDDTTDVTLNIDRWCEKKFGHNDWAFLDTFSDQEKVGLEDVADIVDYKGQTIVVYFEARPEFLNGDI